jgi:hypothetical protein
MKLLFHKTEYYGHLFNDNENPNEFTDKIPLSTGYIFDEELNDWVLKPVPEPKIEQETISNGEVQ